MSERKEGWYWVRLNNCHEWHAIQKDRHGQWVVAANNTVTEIGPRIPSPDEPWQTAPDTANEEMLKEGVESLQRGMNRFSGNHTQIVSNIFEDMLAVAPKPEDV